MRGFGTHYGVIVAIVLVTVTVDAFTMQPRSSITGTQQQQQQQQQPQHSATTGTTTTLLRVAQMDEQVEKKQQEKKSQTKTMTPEDEEVLFGQDELLERHPTFPGRHRTTSKSGNVLKDPIQPLNELDHSTTNPLINKLHTMRESQLKNCPDLWTQLSKINPDQVALVDDHLCDNTKYALTFQQMDSIVDQVATNFMSKFGLRPNQHVAVLGENSARWLMIDHGIQRAGGVSAVRGADAPIDELRYIYEHSDSAGIAVLQGPKLLRKLWKDTSSEGGLGLQNDKYGRVQYVVLMHREKTTNEELEKLASEINSVSSGGSNTPIQFYFLDDLLNDTDVVASSSDFPKRTHDDLATIVYTSGTTGRPKGVMLSHGNLLHQTSHRLAPSRPYEETEPLPGETMVSLLPVWHITERSFELWMLSRSCTVVYSNIKHFRNDMAKYQPEWLVLVPRVLEKIAAGVQDKFSNGSAAVKILSGFFTKTGRARAQYRKLSKGLAVGDESPGGLERLWSKALVTGLAPLNAVGDKLVWSKVQAGFGGKLKTIISGGSALAGNLEQFYEQAGFKVVVGYGLTECSPLLSFRRTDGNLVTGGCCGKPCLDTEVRVVDPESKATPSSDRPSLPIGEVGVVIGRGPQIMKGYYKNPEATAKAIDEYGWFDTGDLGRINPATGDLILTGRVKDTIVLSNGENIEPQPLEDAILGGTNGLVDQVMLTGQDGRRLVSIVVLSPAELANLGFLDREQADKLQAANEVLNDPKCTVEDCDEYSKVLRQVSVDLRQNQDLQNTLVGLVRSATGGEGFRAWEQVSTVYVTMEPFAMVNGQLTQSYKVKRDSVMDRYGDELPQ
eukprot:CAMPEP_0113496736 /NCGR_PEP_ID=MMETSP0014_2-20120614/30273_1 /TAXON_ID=2857 /ORGANISM="Nitzschia sp." /LENGTH=840 /DNA_ID=CAMNT_0000390663 /DNA_START=284 /DNA_END=2806 /DNA_ORIENTATION=+ /assembly_acc=CAM_ASM_000159